MKSGTVRTRNTVGPPDWLLWQSKSAWHTAPMTRFTLQPIEPIESRPSQQKVEACSAPLQCSSRASKKATGSYEAKQSSSSSLRLQLWQLRDIQFLDLLAGTYKNPSHVAHIYEKRMKHARGWNFPVTFSSLCGPILGFLGFLGLLPFRLLKGLMVKHGGNPTNLFPLWPYPFNPKSTKLQQVLS